MHSRVNKKAIFFVYNETSNNDILSDVYQKSDWLILNITVSHDVTEHFAFSVNKWLVTEKFLCRIWLGHGVRLV